MGRLQRIENKLERAINGAFAKAFRSEVQPVEIASAVRRAMDDGATSLAKGRTFVPTTYRVELSENDYERLHSYEDDLEEELLAAAEEHAETQRYQAKTGFAVSFAKDPQLETGLFRVVTDESRHETRMPARSRFGGAGSDSGAGSEPGYHPPDATTHRRSNEPDYRRSDEPAHGGPSGPGGPGGAAAYGLDDDPLDIPPTRPGPPPGRPAQHRPLTATDRPWLELDGDRYFLLGALTVLGRDNDCAIIVDDVNASRRHSEIRVTVDGPRLVATVRDLDSTNGTWVNGERITSRRLNNGDRLTVGKTSFVFRSGRR